MAATKHRTIRVPDATWAAAQDMAARQGTTVSAVVVASLQRYARLGVVASSQQAGPPSKR